MSSDVIRKWSLVQQRESVLSDKVGHWLQLASHSIQKKSTMVNFMKLLWWFTQNLMANLRLLQRMTLQADTPIVSFGETPIMLVRPSNVPISTKIMEGKWWKTNQQKSSIPNRERSTAVSLVMIFGSGRDSINHLINWDFTWWPSHWIPLSFLG